MDDWVSWAVTFDGNRWRLLYDEHHDELFVPLEWPMNLFVETGP